MKLIVLIFTFSIFQLAYCQDEKLDSLLETRSYSEFENFIRELPRINSDSSEYYFYLGKYHLQNRKMASALHELIKVDTLKLTYSYKPFYYDILGEMNRYLNKEERAFLLKTKAKSLFINDDNLLMANKVNYDLHYILVSQHNLNYDGKSYLYEFYETAKKLKDTKQLFAAHLTYATLSFDESYLDTAKYHFREATRLVKEMNNQDNYFKLYNYKAVFHQNMTHNLDSAMIYSDRMLDYARHINLATWLDSSYKTKAYTLRLQQRYEEAIQELNKARRLMIQENVYNRKFALFTYLSLNHENIGKLDSAYYFLKQANFYKDSIGLERQNTLLTALSTIELDKQNIVLDKKRMVYKNSFIITLVGLFFVLLITIIVVLNLRKKKLLAEKEKELKNMRIENLLKEQELQNIDALNEGRDKERQRIAADIHDDLGSLLTTIKLYFQNLSVRKNKYLEEEELLLQRTNKLLDEAYQKVRNIAQVEDAASRISEGLVASINNFALKVSRSEDLPIEVHASGLDRSLDGEIENDLRRATIELITNAIKHSKASEINIDIILRDGVLSIMVEDNGIGFDFENSIDKKGLGLYNIKRKIEKLKGNFIVESIKHKGTTIILEIPI